MTSMSGEEMEYVSMENYLNLMEENNGPREIRARGAYEWNGRLLIEIGAF